MSDIKVTFPGGKKVSTEINGFTIETDQSQSVGVTSSSPSPFDLFLTSIASCTGITILSFCQNKGIDTTGLSMKVSLEKNDDGDVTKVITEVTRPKDFPEKYVGAIEHISKACKVKRHIENPPEFEISVK